MTGQPPEAPDHEPLTPSELQRLHVFAANQMRRRAEGMVDLAFCATFKRGDVVLVHQISKRSHLDKRGNAGLSYPARAVIVKQSSTNESHYQIRWLTDGLHANEKTGDVSKKMWIAWRMKLCKTGPSPHVGKDVQAQQDKIVEEVLRDDDDADGAVDPDKDDDANMARRTADEIEEIAQRYVRKYLCICVWVNNRCAVNDLVPSTTDSVKTQQTA